MNEDAAVVIWLKKEKRRIKYWKTNRMDCSSSSPVSKSIDRRKWALEAMWKWLWGRTMENCLSYGKELNGRAFQARRFFVIVESDESDCTICDVLTDRMAFPHSSFTSPAC